MIPQGFLDVAAELQAQAPSSLNPTAFWRSSISRSYYGAYHAAAEYQTTVIGCRLHNTGKDHQDIPRRFIQCSDTSLNIVGRKLIDLRTKRRHADYRLKKPFQSPPLNFVALDVLQQAESVLLTLSAGVTTPTHKLKQEMNC